MGNTTVTGVGPRSTHLFGEDATFEDLYQNSVVVDEENNYELVTVIAPSGPLGVMFNTNAHGNLPVVYAIKETSALREKLMVGDMVVSVDEVNCSGMSSHTLSAFLSTRSQNQHRVLTLARGDGSATYNASLTAAAV